MKIKLLIADPDREYLDRFTAMLNGRYGDRLEVYSFGDMNAAREAFFSINPDVVLVSSALGAPEERAFPGCGIAVLAERADEAAGGMPSIFKYQRAEAVFRQILGVYAQRAPNGARASTGRNGARLLLCVSFAGGTGTSSVAAAIALAAAKKGAEALYLDLDYLADPGLFFGEAGGGGFSDVIYAMKSRRSHLGLTMESALSRSADGVYFFERAESASDALELEDDELLSLIRELRGLETPELIVCGVPADREFGRWALWREATGVILITAPDPLSRAKLSRGLEMLEETSGGEAEYLLQKAGALRNKAPLVEAGTSGPERLRDLGKAPLFAESDPAALVEALSECAAVQAIAEEALSGEKAGRSGRGRPTDAV